jgi:hypothetical protein
VQAAKCRVTSCMIMSCIPRISSDAYKNGSAAVVDSHEEAVQPSHGGVAPQDSYYY